MKPKVLKFDVSEISPEEMKNIMANDPGTPTPDESGTSGCYAVANCPDGKPLMCMTHIKDAKCYTTQISVGDGPFFDTGVCCAGVCTECSGTGGDSGSGDDKPTPPSINPTGTL